MKPLKDLLLEVARDPDEETLLEIEATFGVSVGWRCEPEYLLDWVTNQLREHYGSGELLFSLEAAHIDISFRGQKVKIRTKQNHRLCFDLVRAVNTLLTGNYELRSMKYRSEESFRTFVIATPDQWRVLDQVDPDFEHFEPVTDKSGFLLDKYSWPVARILEWVGTMFVRLFVAVIMRRTFRSQ